jgi:glycosyltransferase involved in cell wall biosynthesis
MTPISVVVITYNEEANIERCLLSAGDIADEILVVDSFSTDKTEEICKTLNVRFIQHKFEGYIEQKDWAANQANYDHILSLDADEVISEKLKNSILDVKSNWVFDAYSFNRLNYYCGKWIRHSGWYPDRKIRLFNRKTGKWMGENPHDKVELAEGSTQMHIKGDLLHYTYYSVKEHINQTVKFAELSAVAAFKKGKKAGIFSIIVHTIWKFKRNYFFKLGFLDGYYGFVICTITAIGTFFKYVRLRELNHSKKIS